MGYAAKPGPAAGRIASESAIRAHLAVVVSSPVFAGSERLVRFLQFVVDEALAGRGSSLKESLVGMEVFERAPDYDPKIDPIVRVQARRLRAKLEQFYAAAPFDSPFRIELPKGSYVPQFNAAPAVQEPAAEAAPSAVTPSPRRRWYTLGAVFAAIGLLAYGVMEMRPPTGLTLRMRPLTNQPGYQTTPAFSPDGRTVAFSWEGPDGKNPDIYIQGVDADAPRRLTTSQAREQRPVWAPDGARLAFVRELEGNRFAIVDIPVSGSGEHQLARVSGEAGYPPRIDWSPDGNWIYTNERDSPAEPSRIVRISLATGERQRLSAPPAGAPGDAEAVVSPDGRLIAFERASEVAIQDIWIMDSSGGKPRQITHDGAGTLGLAWMPDSRHLVVSSRRGSSLQRLWRFSTSGGEPVCLTDAAVAASWPSVSRSGRIAYASRFFDVNIWRFDLANAAPPARLIASNVLDSGAQYSPDGGHIAFRSNRTGNDEVWVVDAGGREPVRMTHFAGPVAGSAQWSPDGSVIALDSRPYGNADVFLAAANGSNLRRFTDSPSNEVLPRFSSDGRALYFASDRSGSWQIWKQPIAGGAAAKQITINGGFAGYETADGRWLYFSKGGETTGLFRSPSEGGEESLIIPDLPGSMWGNWAPRAGGSEIVYVSVSGAERLCVWDVAKGVSRTIAPLPFAPVYRDTGLRLSLDGRIALVSQTERAGSTIYVGE